MMDRVRKFMGKLFLRIRRREAPYNPFLDRRYIWYEPKLSDLDMTRQLVRRREPGTFIVTRSKSHNNTYILSYYGNEGVGQLIIRRYTGRGEWHLTEFETNRMTFLTMQDLISFFMENELEPGTGDRLIRPLNWFPHD